MELEDVMKRARRRKGEELPSLERRRAIRKQAGLTQSDLADVLNVHLITVARYEAGTREPRGEHRTRYLGVLRQLATVGLETTA